MLNNKPLRNWRVYDIILLADYGPCVVMAVNTIDGVLMVEDEAGNVWQVGTEEIEKGADDE